MAGLGNAATSLWPAALCGSPHFEPGGLPPGRGRAGSLQPVVGERGK